MKHLIEYVNEANRNQEEYDAKAKIEIDKWTDAMKNKDFVADLKESVFELFENDIKHTGKMDGDSDGEEQYEYFTWSDNKEIEQLETVWKGHTYSFSAYPDRRDNYKEVLLDINGLDDTEDLRTSKIDGAKKLNSKIGSFLTTYVQEIDDNAEKIFNDEY